MDTFCIHNARKMRTNFSLVYISPCTFKCPIKITRQSSHRCAELPGNTLANTVPAIMWRRRHAVHRCLPPPRVTFLSLHSWDQRKPTFRYIIPLPTSLATTVLWRECQWRRCRPLVALQWRCIDLCDCTPANDYTLWVKKNGLRHNFGRCWSIFKIISFLDSAINLQ